MGICSSCDATAVVGATATAKLILPDGSLQEYSWPIRVSQVILKDPSWFVCNADELGFDDYVSPIGDNEQLFPGQLYFALPKSMLRRRLNPEEMAALAVRASTALVKSGAVAVSFGGALAGGDGQDGGVVDVGRKEEKRRRRRRTGSGGSGRSFTSDLSAIPE